MGKPWETGDLYKQLWKITMLLMGSHPRYFDWVYYHFQ